jgi:hypothetical protein
VIMLVASFGAEEPGVGTSPITPSAEPVLRLGDAADRSIGRLALDSLFEWMRETPERLASTLMPAPIALPLTAREAEALFASDSVRWRHAEAPLCAAKAQKATGVVMIDLLEYLHGQAESL